LNEAAAHLYLLIATYVLDRRFISEPMPLQDLVGVMHCEPITVRRARKRLTSLGELRLIDGGQGKADLRFELVKMAGPLYAEKGGSQSPKFTAASDSVIEVTGADLGSESPRYAATSIPQSEVGDVDPFITLEEEDRSTTSEERAADGELTREGLEAAVAVDSRRADRFCEWWTVMYPAHNGGALSRIRPCDENAAFSLVMDRPMKRLQAMAIEFWSLRGNYNRSDRAYIGTSDHSIRVLLEKSQVIEKEVMRLGLDPSSVAVDDHAAPDLDDMRREIEQRLGHGWRKSG